MRRVLFYVMVVAVAGLAWRALQGRAPAAPTLTIDTLLDIKHPSDPEWSPDGTRVAYIWDRAGVQNVWMVTVRDGRAQAPVDLTRSASGLIRGMFWNHDGSRVLFGRDGNLWQVAPDGTSQPEPVWQTPENEGGMAISPDGGARAFSRGGDISIRSLADGRDTQLTSTPEGESSPGVVAGRRAHRLLGLVLRPATARARGAGAPESSSPGPNASSIRTSASSPSPTRRACWWRPPRVPSRRRVGSTRPG